MKPVLNGRAAPILALFVILAGAVLLLQPRSPQDSPAATSAALVVTLTPTPDVTVTATLPPSSATPSHSADSIFERRRLQGSLQAALYQIEAQALTAGWNEQLHIQAGNLWRDMGDTDRALPYWEAANQRVPNPLLLRQIAGIYLERGEWGLAYERIEQLLSLAPNDLWGLFYGALLLAPSDPLTAYGYLGRVAPLERDYASLALDLMGIIGGAQGDPILSLRVGAALATAGEYSLAENAFQYAASVYYPFAEAEAYTALMRVQQGKNGANAMNQAVAFAPESAVVRYIEGLYWRALRNFEQSQLAFIRAIRFDPGNALYYAELGSTYREAGDLNEAEIWLQSAVEISGKDPVIVAALERFYAEEALLLPDDYLAYLGEQPARSDDPGIISARGWTMHVLGDSAAGLAQVEEALQADPQNPRALFDKARILLDTGRGAEAVPLLEQLAAGESAFAVLASRLLEAR